LTRGKETNTKPEDLFVFSMLKSFLQNNTNKINKSALSPGISEILSILQKTVNLALVLKSPIKLELADEVQFLFKISYKVGQSIGFRAILTH